MHETTHWTLSSCSAIANAIETRYSFDKTLVKEVEYDPDARMIIVDVQKAKGDRKADLSRMAYYMEKDVSHDLSPPFAVSLQWRISWSPLAYVFWPQLNKTY